MTFYNDNDHFCVQWLHNLMRDGLITPGRIDFRGIDDIERQDIQASRAHFFAGIGGWDYALQLAGWPASRAVWTGSCPCQPFSVAGSKKGTADKRHVWPSWYRLIRECKPATIFGEQVASKDGRQWLSGVRADLEALGYAVGCADLCAAGVGAPHIRQRLYWVANAQSGDGRRRERSAKERIGQDGIRRQRSSGSGGMGHSEMRGFGVDRTSSRSSRYSHISIAIRQEQSASELRSFWDSGCYVECKDGKWRLIEPSICPVAHGIPNRVGLIRGGGNAIVPQIAAEFVRAFMEAVA